MVLHIYDPDADTFLPVPDMPPELPLQLHNALHHLQAIASAGKHPLCRCVYLSVGVGFVYVPCLSCAIEVCCRRRSGRACAVQLPLMSVSRPLCKCHAWFAFKPIRNLLSCVNSEYLDGLLCSAYHCTSGCNRACLNLHLLQCHI